ncbi:hypothetical protein HYE08_03585 [Mycoplasmopsis bovis]|nr:site-specific DNA-methyltransferase [Mycoplasmopsis bovis]QQH27154.1 hypothetical protein HYE08_03585 [Mycoplasmopsis bovis]
MKLDQHLLDLLLSNQLITETFFTKTKNALVFNQNKFAKFIDSKEFLEDSYTSYANKIGLTSGDEFISKILSGVVLDFPSLKIKYNLGGGSTISYWS